jgi:hypothetical protein
MSLLIAHAVAILLHGWGLGGFQLRAGSRPDWTGATIVQRYLQAMELHFPEDWPVQVLHLRILEAARARLEQAFPIRPASAASSKK